MVRDLGIVVAGCFPPARLSPIFPRPPRRHRLAASIVAVDLLRICRSHGLLLRCKSLSRESYRRPAGGAGKAKASAPLDFLAEARHLVGSWPPIVKRPPREPRLPTVPGARQR